MGYRKWSAQNSPLLQKKGKGTTRFNPHLPLPLRGLFIIHMGAPVAQWVQCWLTDLAAPGSSLARGEIYYTVNGVPLHTAFYYHQSVVLV